MALGYELIMVGYGIHYPVRHGQVENWVSLPTFAPTVPQLTYVGLHGTLLV